VVDLNALLLHTDSMLRRVIGEDVTLEVVPARVPAATWADPGQVEQVLLNLAVNARDAMPHGGTLRISIARQQVGSPPEGIEPGPFAVVEVVDNGVGIPEDVLPRIFEPFFTTKEFGAGTGLGLATVYGILQQTGGWVEVESTAGTGSRFRAFFPAHAGDANLRARDLDTDSVPRGSERILVVEDEVAVRSLVRRVLERLGYRVLEAADGREGLRVLASQPVPFDLILSDVVMPGMSGPEFLEQCRVLSPRCRLALMSGYAADRLPAPVGGHQAFPFIEKPFEPAALGRIVRELLDGDAPPADPGATA
jgi:CheY-like chemotaxis protein